MENFDYSLNEKTILGCLIMFPDLYADKLGELSADLFCDKVHREIFTAIVSAYKRTGTVDTALVVANASPEYKVAILECADIAFRTTPFDEHLKILLENAQRKFLQEQYNAALLEGDMSPQRLRQIADFAEQTYSQTQVNSRNVFTSYVKNLDNPNFGLKTYFPSLDKVTGGLKRGTLAIIGARPSVGKTTLALNIATNLVLNGKKVMFFTLEMTAPMILDKMVAAECKIPYICFNGKLNKADKDVIKSFLNNEAVRNNFKIIDDVFTVENICSVMASQKPDVAVVDYAQIVQTLEKFGGAGKRAQIDYISSKLKNVAKRTKCCVILLSQLKRPDSDKPKCPTMSDLKESGGLEQDGDYIFMLHRPYVQDKENSKPEDAVLCIDKHKFGGVGRIPLFFDGKYQQFREKTKAPAADFPFT